MAAPVLQNQTPAHHAAGVAPNAVISVDVINPTAAAAAVVNGLGDLWAEDVFAGGGAALHTTAQPFVSGSLEVYLDGIRSLVPYTEAAYVPGSGVPSFTFDGGSAPAATEIVARYRVNFLLSNVQVAGPDGIKVYVGPQTGPLEAAFLDGVFQPGFAGTITPIDYGYTVTITTHPLFGSDVPTDVLVDSWSMDETPLHSALSWTFGASVLNYVEDLGGTALSVVGFFDQVPSQVDVMVGTNAHRCYSGVSGHGFSITPTAAGVSFVTPPLPVGGPYDVRVKHGATEVTLAAAVLSVPHAFRTGTYSLRASFSPRWAVGPRTIDQTPLQS